MKTNTTRIAILAFALAIAGSPAMAGAIIQFGHVHKARPGSLNNIHSIAVIDAQDEQFHFTQIGLTVFSNSDHTIPTANWDIGGTLVKVIRATVGPHISVVKSDVDPTAARHAYSHLFHTLGGQLTDIVAAIPKPEADAYIVLKQFDPYGDDIGRTGVDLGGLGLYHRDIGTDITAEYDYLSIYLIESRTGAILATETMCFPTTPGQCDHKDWLPVKPSYWADDAKALTDDQKNDLRNTFISFLSTGVTGALQEMGLAEPSEQEPPPSNPPQATPSNGEAADGGH